MRILLVGLALVSLAAVRSDSPVRQVPHDPAAKSYVFSDQIADEVLFCVKVSEDQHLACVSVGSIRATYRKRR